MLDKIRYSCYNKLYNDEEPINFADSDAHGNDQKNIKEDQFFKSIQSVSMILAKVRSLAIYDGTNSGCFTT